MHEWAVELGCDLPLFVEPWPKLLSIYESPHPYKIKNKKNQLIRTIHSVWLVSWLCLGVKRVVRSLTQLLHWAQEASGMYPSPGWILFLRSQRTTKTKTSAFQNIEERLFFGTCARFPYSQWSAHPTFQLIYDLAMGVVVVLWSEVSARVFFNCVAKTAHL